LITLAAIAAAGGSIDVRCRACGNEWTIG